MVSNTGELAAIRTVDEVVRLGSKVLIVDDGHSSRIGLMAAISAMGMAVGLGHHVPRFPAAPPRYERHQGEKERLRRLQRAGHTHHCAARIVWGDGECECQLKGLGYGRASRMIAEAVQP